MRWRGSLSHSELWVNVKMALPIWTWSACDMTAQRLKDVRGSRSGPDMEHEAREANLRAPQDERGALNRPTPQATKRAGGVARSL